MYNIIQQIKKPMIANKNYLSCEISDELIEIARKKLYEVTDVNKTTKKK